MEARKYTSMVVEAPAKINWFLEVLGKRDDGYHNISTVMQTIDWRDRLTLLSRDDGRIELTTDAPNLPVDDRNLVVKAARALQSITGTQLGASIHLEKRIPSGAGLGGGSSDAASTLAALNQLWSTQLEQPQLSRLASILGSDIPFFLHAPLARCEGRGEQVSQLRQAQSIPLVVIWPSVETPTSMIYRSGLIDLTSPRRKCNFSYDFAMLRQGGRGPVSDDVVFNRLAIPCESLFEPVREATSIARQCVGKRLVSLSGSGSAFFVICDSPTDAESTRDLLQPLMPPGSVIRVTHTLTS